MKSSLFIIEHFLCCFDLETGGFVLGWLSLVMNILSVITLFLGLILTGIVECRDVIEFLNEHGNNEITLENCGVFKIVTFFVLIISILFMIGFIAIDVLLIRGTQKRDHILIRPSFIVVAVFGIFIVISNLLTFSISGVLTAVIYGIIYWYIFACLYSLYVKFQNEKQGTAQYMHP
ncbi:hypothetical protein PVAND_008989 [Polypedilum vanderplanki]|uniref:Uncharacterized protein n=1 Tax=Polypedilum vanderplanki TaxID=319348 RepID=A0A9J6CCR5_POLVA|nr:hypothetical protein PVAND_008989 [Polypedilum vanderplanki]